MIIRVTATRIAVVLGCIGAAIAAVPLTAGSAAEQRASVAACGADGAAQDSGYGVNSRFECRSGQSPAAAAARR